METLALLKSSMRLLLAAAVMSIALMGCNGSGGINPGPGPGPGDERSAEVMAADDDYPDDTLDSKNPAYVDYMVVDRAPGYRTGYMNPSDSVISLKIIEPEGGSESESSSKLYRNFAEVYADTAISHRVMVSIDLIDRFTKSTDDAAYGAIELSYHDSAVYPGGKQGLLTDILAALMEKPVSAGRDLAAAFIGAALQLGGGAPDTAGAIATKQQAIVDTFLGNPGRSKVLGFYTEDETLKRVFQRDRVLQESFGMKTSSGLTEESIDDELSAMAAIAAVLDANPEMLTAYEKYQLTAERITNPTSNLDLRDLLPFKDQFGNPVALRESLLNSEAWQTKVLDRNASSGTNAGVAVWPFSTSKETVLFRDIPADEIATTDFMEYLIDAIRSGEISLEPTELSGWYDYQTFAIETFLLPEMGFEYQNLMMQGLYKKRLKSAFESLLTQRRETHIKQLEIGVGPTCEPPPPAVPPLTIEPVPTHLLRTARGYSMLRSALGEVLGDDEFGSIGLADGSTTVVESLEYARALFYGLYLLSSCEIGIAPQLLPGELSNCSALIPAEDYADYLNRYPVALEPGISDDGAARRIAACQLAEEWRNGLKEQTLLLSTDSRVIVPVFFDPELKVWTNWAVIGVTLKKLEASYARPPRVITYNEWGDPVTPEEARQRLAASEGLASPYWEPLEKFLPVYEFAEVKMTADPLTREEFRAVCDQYQTHEEIVTALAEL